MPDLRNRNWISRLCNGGLLLIACLACGILLGLNVAYNAVITEAWKEQVVILPGAARGLGLLAVTILLTIGAGLLPQKPRVGGEDLLCPAQRGLHGHGSVSDAESGQRPAGRRTAGV